MHGAVDAVFAAAELRTAGFTLLALTPAPDAVPLGEVDWPVRLPRSLLGAEGPGLSDAALAAADVRVRIPMRADVDSLNVATAGGRSRSTKGPG